VSNYLKHLGNNEPLEVCKLNKEGEEWRREEENQLGADRGGIAAFLLVADVQHGANQPKRKPKAEEGGRGHPFRGQGGNYSIAIGC
jgi:hypothetical protein